jgi:signal transduction histidine kinase
MTRSRDAALYALAWLPLAVVWTAIGWAGGGGLLFPFLSSAATTLVAALLGVEVWHASGRLSWPQPRAWSFFARHAAWAIAFALILDGLQVVVIAYFSPYWRNRGTPWSLLVANGLAWLAWTTLFNLLLYGLIAGVCYTRRGHQRLQERALAAARAEAAAAQAEAAAARAQLRALRAQLNPHFLFNALHSLAVLMRQDPALAEKALDRLGELLRYALDDGAGDWVTVAEEWTFVTNYLDLERLRFGRRLRVDTVLDPDALDCVVPSFVLQPLVENAVRHGIAPRPEGGRVAIHVTLEDEALRIRVRDDGPGTTPQAAESSSGLGLRALRERLGLGTAGGRMVVTTSPGHGFDVAVILPVREEAPWGLGP